MSRWFGHIKRINERILTKQVYENGKVERGIPRCYFLKTLLKMAKPTSMHD